MTQEISDTEFEKIKVGSQRVADTVGESPDTQTLDEIKETAAQKGLTPTERLDLNHKQHLETVKEILTRERCDREILQRKYDLLESERITIVRNLAALEQAESNAKVNGWVATVCVVFGGAFLSCAGYCREPERSAMLCVGWTLVSIGSVVTGVANKFTWPGKLKDFSWYEKIFGLIALVVIILAIGFSFRLGKTTDPQSPAPTPPLVGDDSSPDSPSTVPN